MLGPQFRNYCLLVLASALMLLVYACGGSPAVTGAALTFGNLKFSSPATGGQVGSLSLDWSGGVAPYTLSIDYGGAAVNPEPLLISLAPITQSLTFSSVSAEAGQTYIIEVTITDAVGSIVNHTQPLTIAQSPNIPPVIDSIEVVGGQIAVTAHDPDGDNVNLFIESASGAMRVNPGNFNLGGGQGRVTFSAEARNGLLGAQGVLTISAVDQLGAIETATSPTVRIEPWPLEPGSLYAIPLVEECNVNDTIRVAVVAGPLEKSLFGADVSLVFPPGTDFVHSSLDMGAPNPLHRLVNPPIEEDYSGDGIWTATGAAISPSGFTTTISGMGRPIQTTICPNLLPAHTPLTSRPGHTSPMTVLRFQPALQACFSA